MLVQKIIETDSSLVSHFGKIWPNGLWPEFRAYIFKIIKISILIEKFYTVLELYMYQKV